MDPISIIRQAVADGEAKGIHLRCDDFGVNCFDGTWHPEHGFCCPLSMTIIGTSSTGEGLSQDLSKRLGVSVNWLNGFWNGFDGHPVSDDGDDILDLVAGHAVGRQLRAELEPNLDAYRAWQNEIKSGSDVTRLS